MTEGRRVAIHNGNRLMWLLFGLLASGAMLSFQSMQRKIDETLNRIAKIEVKIAKIEVVASEARLTRVEDKIDSLIVDRTRTRRRR